MKNGLSYEFMSNPRDILDSTINRLTLQPPPDLLDENSPQRRKFF